MPRFTRTRASLAKFRWLFLLLVLLSSRSVAERDLTTPATLPVSFDLAALDVTSSEADSKIHRDDKDDGFFGYKPIFHALKSAWYGDQNEIPTILSNNYPSRNVITPGATHRFVFPLNEIIVPRTIDTPIIPPRIRDKTEDQEWSHLELRKRESGPRRLHLTLNICRQPIPGPFKGPPAGLNLHVLPQIREGHGTEPSSGGHWLETEEGYAHYASDVNEDVNVEIAAPYLEGYHGQYIYEVTASIDHAYSLYNDFESLEHLDSDHGAGTFITSALTNSSMKDEEAIKAWMETGTPFTVFLHPRDDPTIHGLRRSYCGLSENAHIKTGAEGVASSLTLFGGHSIKQQFHVAGLDSGATYNAILGLPSNYSKRGAGTPTGGGTVWKSLDFRTRETDNCLVVSNLAFCNAISYAVPSPSNDTINATQLGKLYDDFASQSFQNFSFSLDQIACSTDPESQYSLATNCTQCLAAYKSWVCAVSIPRCANSALNSSEIILRRATNSSRNLFINEQIQPGPYIELPPCGNLCFGLVQNCPTSLGFACPYPNTVLYNQSYGYQDRDTTFQTCNSYGFPITWGLSGASSLRPSSLNLFLTALTIILSSGTL